MVDGTCTVRTCDRPLKSRIHCAAHNTRLWMYGDVQADKPIRLRCTKAQIPPTCVVATCPRQPASRGWCKKHYGRFLRTGKVDDWQDPGCSIEHCERSHYGGPGKWCRIHYRRWKTHGDPLKVERPWQSQPRPPQPCMFADCPHPRRSLGMCRPHYTKRWLREHPEARRAISRRQYARRAEALRLAAKKYRAANRDKVREAGRRWAANNPDQVKILLQRRRARKRNAPVNDLTAKEWVDIKAAYRQRCAYCQKCLPLTMDHVVSLVRGGSHTASNVVPACRSCNSRKGVGPAPIHQPLLF